MINPAMVEFARAVMGVYKDSYVPQRMSGSIADLLVRVEDALGLGSPVTSEESWASIKRDASRQSRSWIAPTLEHRVAMTIERLCQGILSSSEFDPQMWISNVMEEILSSVGPAYVLEISKGWEEIHPPLPESVVDAITKAMQEIATKRLYDAACCNGVHLSAAASA